MKFQKALLLAVAAVASASVAHAGKVVIKGSDTLGAKLVPQLAEAFKATNPGTKFEIAAEGSTTGITAVIDGTADIGMSSRRAKATEVSAAVAKGKSLTPTIVAYDGIVVIVNQNNPLKNLTKDQVEKIFTGDVTDWSAVGGSAGKISVYTRNTASGTYSDWKELAMKKRDYAPSAQKLAGNEQIVAEVAKNPNGIGYVGIAYTHEAGIHAVSVGGVAPSAETIRSKTFPYSRPTFYYTNGKIGGEAGAFEAFTVSPAGQKIVSQVGFVAIK
ncbi:MAG TPA: phosphate ABC transporter substrate-binding protein [Chthoniobacterales bacterium]